MRLAIIQSVFRKELTELLRNRRSLVVMFGVPLLLYPILTIAVASLAEGKQKEMTVREAHIVVVGAESAPRLMKMLADAQRGVRAAAEPPGDFDSQLKAGSIDAEVIVPANYETDAIAGKYAREAKDAVEGKAAANKKDAGQSKGTDVDGDDDAAAASPDEIAVRVDRSRTATPFAEAKLSRAIAEYQQWIVEQRLAARGLPAGLAARPRRVVTDIATSGQTFGALLSRMLPVLLLLTGMLGALYPALNATTTERELGTLETLLVTPATRGELLTAKAGIVLLSGLLTALLNMVSMSLVLWRTLSQMERVPAGLSIDAAALALSYLAAVPTLIFFTALVLMVGLLARNLREANAYATPVMLIPITSMLIGIADPATSPGLLVTPVANTTVIIRDVLTGHSSTGAFALAFVSSCLYAGLVLSLASRVFTNEQLVNPAWEPLSLKGLGRRTRKAPRYPAVDEALTLFALSLLLNFYVTPSWMRHGLLPLLCGVELLLIAAPAVLFAWIGHYRWRDVFSLRRPSPLALAGAACMGLGLIPLVDLLSWLQQHYHLLPPSQADLEGMSKLFEPALRAHPFLLPVALGILAGVCEELLFRGPIQSAFVRRLPIGLALAFGALLFAAAHVDLSGLPLRFALGMVLGWVVWRTGSIFPAMLLHALYDGVKVGWATYELLHTTAAESTTILNPLADNVDRMKLVVGIILTLFGMLLIRRSPPAPAAAETKPLGFAAVPPKNFPVSP